jgi:hypothetical protein
VAIAARYATIGNSTNALTDNGGAVLLPRQWFRNMWQRRVRNVGPTTLADILVTYDNTNFGPKVK